MESLGRSVAQAAKAAELARDVGGKDGPIAKETLSAYLTALDRLHLLDNSPAWLPHMRSRARLRTAPVRYFVDPSIGPAALGVGTSDLANDLNALGLHYEALVIRDVRIYAQPLDARVDCWRDSEGHEVDAVVSAGPNKWGAFEIKLSPDAVDEAAAAHFASKPTWTRLGRGNPHVLASSPAPERAASVQTGCTSSRSEASDHDRAKPVTSVRTPTRVLYICNATRPILLRRGAHNSWVGLDRWLPLADQ